MATGRAVEAGRAFIRIVADNTQAFRQLRRMERRFQRFGDRIQQIASAIAGAFAGQMATRGILGLADIAGEVQVVERRFALLFRNISDEAEASAKQFSETYQTALYRVRQQFVQARALLTPLALAGANESQMLRLTTMVAKIQQDFSVLGLSVEESQARIVSALTSTGEAVDQFGFNVRAAALESELLALGIDKTVQQATEEEKALAKLSLLRKSLANQQLDAATSLGLYNMQTGRLLDNIKAVGGEIGEHLLPMMLALVTAINKTTLALTSFFDKHPWLARAIASIAIGAGVIVGIMGAISAIAGIALVLAPAIAAMALFPVIAAGILVAGGTAAATTAITSRRAELEENYTYQPAASGYGAMYRGTMGSWTPRARTESEEEPEDNVARAAGLLTAGGFTGPAWERSVAFGGANASIEAQQLNKLENIEDILQRVFGSGD